MSGLSRLPAWKALEAHRHDLGELDVRGLFASCEDRFERMSLRFEDMLFDYSKHLVTEKTLELFASLAAETGVEARREEMFAGRRINATEKRSVLHVALRAPKDERIFVDGQDVVPGVHEVLSRMRDFCREVHEGRWTGYTGKRITDVVNLGIGGSDLGPRMAVKALGHFAVPGMQVHFVSNVDGAHFLETVKNLTPETTLFIVASKTFTTQETMANAASAKAWLLGAAGDQSAVARHFVALSTNEGAVKAFGIDTRNMFPFWDWVGGRYSLWSAIGLSIALAVGFDRFEELLAGARAMDVHFRTAPPQANMPILMAMLAVWYNDFFGAQTRAVLPYSQYLEDFPAYLQQGDMESNGKSVTLSGEPVDYQTGPVIWGQAGTNGQHAFYQLIHQGTKLIPADFIAYARPPKALGQHHPMLLSNFFAQTEALLRGKTLDEARAELLKQGMSEAETEALAPHRVFTGNKPTTSILFAGLTPYSLGRLIALYEHAIFVQGVVWEVNSFDQWGVELGKQLAGKILPELLGAPVSPDHDGSTRGLITAYKAMTTVS